MVEVTKRSLFNKYACHIYGWPSGGGVIIRPQADAIEMEYVGLDRFEPQETRCADQEDEDAFCLRLMSIGGKWWCSERRFALIWSELNHYATDMEDETDEEMRSVWVGYPESGGIWVSEYQSYTCDIKIPADIGRLRTARTMEERCELLRTKFGAVYYERPQDYAGLSYQRAIFSEERAAS